MGGLWRRRLTGIQAAMRDLACRATRALDPVLIADKPKQRRYSVYEEDFIAQKLASKYLSPAVCSDDGEFSK